MYKLHTTDINLPSGSEFENIITDKSNIQQLRNKLAVVKPVGYDNYITRDTRELIDNHETDEAMLKIGIQLFPDMYNQFDDTFDRCFYYL